MQELVYLGMQGFGDEFVAMTDIEASYAARQIEKNIPVNILDAGAFGSGNEDWNRLRNATRNGRCLTAHQCGRFRSRNRRLQLNGSHQYHPIGCSFRLM